VSRYFDRIMHPAQLLTALPRAIHVLTDAALCGPVTWRCRRTCRRSPAIIRREFFAPATIVFRAQPPGDAELSRAAALLRNARRPLLIAGGGVLYGLAGAALAAFAEKHGVPVAETQGGKGALRWDHPLQLGAIGVTGSPAANDLARDADLVLAVGTRLTDFTTGSHSMFGGAKLVNLNVNVFDAVKWHGVELVGDAGLGLEALSQSLAHWQAEPSWQAKAKAAASAWRGDVERITGRRDAALPYEGEVIGAVQRSARDSAAEDIVVCAAGTLPASCTALARVVAWRLPRRIWLLVHGLRDRGRPRRQDGQARAPGDRHRRRRQLSDAQQRDRDLGDAGQEAGHRRARQSRLWLHQPAAAGLRRGGVQQPVRRLRARAGRRAAH
jgi:3D-(3,5/4)-trihydroxycyclohexane-1,2-dione acylhydrolase (decyclizing)